MDTRLGCAWLLCGTRGAGGEKVRTTRLRIGQNCRAVCTKKSGLMPLMPRAIATARDTFLHLSIERSARKCRTFERPAKQALALATEPRTKREARSVLCHTCQ